MGKPKIILEADLVEGIKVRPLEIKIDGDVVTALTRGQFKVVWEALGKDLSGHLLSCSKNDSPGVLRCRFLLIPSWETPGDIVA